MSITKQGKSLEDNNSIDNNLDKILLSYSNNILGMDLKFYTNKEKILINNECITSILGENLYSVYDFYRCDNHESDFFLCRFCAVKCHNLDLSKLKEYKKSGFSPCMCAIDLHKKCDNQHKPANKLNNYCECSHYFPEFCQYYFYVKKEKCIEYDDWQYEEISSNNNISNLNIGLECTNDDKLSTNNTTVIVRKCLFCFLSIVQDSLSLESNFEDYSNCFNDYVIQVKSIEDTEIQQIPQNERCQCKGDHHKFNTSSYEAATITLFFKPVIFCVKFPNEMLKYGLDYKDLITYMYDSNKNNKLKSILDSFFTNKMDSNVEDESNQKSLTNDIMIFAQFFSSLIENYQMSNEENPFSNVLTVTEMIKIFEISKFKYSQRDISLKQISFAVFYNFTVLPRTFITSQSVLKNDLNFSPFHRNTFLNDISDFFDLLEGEKNFIKLLDNISKFLLEESPKCNIYLEKRLENVFIITIYYFLQILKSFQYYRLNKISLLNKLKDYLKSVIFSYFYLVKYGILDSVWNHKSQNELPQKIEDNSSFIDINASSRNLTNSFINSTINTNHRKTTNILKSRRNTKNIENIDIIDLLNNFTEEDKNKLIEQALIKLNDKFDFSLYLSTILFSKDKQSVPYKSDWVVTEIEEISKMLLIKFNDITINELSLFAKKEDINSHFKYSKFSFQSSDFINELIVILFSQDNKYAKIENIDLIDILIHENDCYIIGMKVMSESRFNKYFDYKCLNKLCKENDQTSKSKLSNFRISLKSALNDYLFKKSSKSEFERLLTIILIDYKIHLAQEFKMEIGEFVYIKKDTNKNKSDIIYNQLDLAYKGYFFELLEILMTLVREKLISLEYITNIFYCIELFICGNPFLCQIVFSEELYTTLLTVDNIDFYQRSLIFYFRSAYILFSYSYKIDCSNFFLTFHLNIVSSNNLIEEFKLNSIINLLLKQILKIRILKDHSNPMSRIFKILKRFRNKINLSSLMKDVFLSYKIPNLFLEYLNNIIDNKDIDIGDNYKNYIEKLLNLSNIKSNNVMNQEQSVPSRIKNDYPQYKNEYYNIESQNKLILSENKQNMSLKPHKDDNCNSRDSLKSDNCMNENYESIDNLSNKKNLIFGINSFINYLVTYYRLLVMLDEDKSSIFQDDELDVIINILIISKNLNPNIKRVFCLIICKFIIQNPLDDILLQNSTNFDSKDNENMLFFMIKKDKFDKPNYKESHLRNMEGLTLLLIESSFPVFDYFYEHFSEYPKCYLTYFNDCCISPIISCYYRSNFTREKFNFQNKYAYYNLIKSFLIAFKIFLKNISMRKTSTHINNKINYKTNMSKKVNKSKHDSINSKIGLLESEQDIDINNEIPIKSILVNSVNKIKDVVYSSNTKNTKKQIDINEQNNYNPFLYLIENYSYYRIKNEDDICSLIEQLNKDITKLSNNEYDTFSDNKVEEIFKYYINFINIKTVCSPFNDSIKVYEDNFMKLFINQYESLKRNFKNLALNSLSKNGDAISNQIKIEMLEICERMISKKESHLDINRYLYFLFKTKIKLYEMDKKLFQNYFIQKHVDFNFYNNIIMYLNKLFKEKLVKQYLSVVGNSDSFEYSIFTIVTLFFSYLCSNGNSNGQAFLSTLKLILYNTNIDTKNKVVEKIFTDTSVKADRNLSYGIRAKKMSNFKEASLNLNRNEYEITLTKFYLEIAITILTYLTYYNNKMNSIEFIEIQKKSDYFKNIYKTVISLFINLIQASYPYIYINVFRDDSFYIWFNLNLKILNKINKHSTLAFYSKEFIKFSNVLLRENTNIDKSYFNLQLDKKIKGQIPIKLILKGIKPSLLINILKTNMKSLFNSHEDSKNIAYTQSNLLYLYTINSSLFKEEKYILSEEIYCFLMNLKYNTDEGTKISNLLQIQHRYKAQEFIFFSKIFKTVEYVYKNMDVIDQEIYEKISIFGNEKQKKLFDLILFQPRKDLNIVKKHVFKLAPQVFFLTIKDYEDLYWVKLENNSEKHSIILNLANKLKNLSENRMSLVLNTSGLLKSLIRLNYLNEDVITSFSLKATVFISTLVNGMLMIENISNVDDRESLNIIELIYWITFGHVLFLSVFILNWIFFNFIYNIQKSKWSLVKGKLPVYSNFINCIINLAYKEFTFLYSLQLFSFVSIIPTMKLVIKALVDKWETFVHTGALIFIIVWVFSGISFYYQNGDYYFEDLDTNLCDSYWTCFLTILNYGLRIGFVKADVLTINSPYYYKRFLLETFFFLINNLILLNAINGIIVDTFQTFREEDNIQNEQINNVCYICSLKRGELEMFGINFENHIKNEHFVINYMEHLISLQFIDNLEMNYLDFFVYSLMKQELTSFIPHKECKELKEYLKK